MPTDPTEEQTQTPKRPHDAPDESVDLVAIVVVRKQVRRRFPLRLQDGTLLARLLTP